MPIFLSARGGFTVIQLARHTITLSEGGGHAFVWPTPRPARVEDSPPGGAPPRQRSLPPSASPWADFLPPWICLL